MRNSRPLRASAPLLALALVLGLGACGTDQTPPPGDTTTTTSDAAPTTPDAAPSSDDGPTTEEPSVTSIFPSDPSGGVALPTGPVPTAVLEQDNVKAAIADLAKRQSVSESEVTVAGYHSVTWNDGSIGCPKPGMMYTQALVPGHLLVLELDDQLYSYHSGGTGEFNYCADPKLPPLETTM